MTTYSILHAARLLLPALAAAAAVFGQLPRASEQGFQLPNGWKLTPAGQHAVLADYVLNVAPSPDGKSLVALHCGHGPHGLVVLDAATMQVRQEVPLKSAWLGLAWSPDGRTLYASGGNAESRTRPTAPR
jgi:hypothetical protein